VGSDVVGVTVVVAVSFVVETVPLDVSTAVVVVAWTKSPVGVTVTAVTTVVFVAAFV
jgi:hypothetical protein